MWHRLTMVCVLAVAACRDRPVAEYPTSPAAVDTDSLLGPGDKFEVVVYGEADLSREYVVPSVARKGEINFPLIGTVRVLGRDPVDIEEEISGRLADGYLVNPSVQVRVLEYRSKRVNVSGAVRQPKTLQYTDGMSIVEAITQAGDFMPLAKKNAVRVKRISTAGKIETFYVAVDDIRRGKAPDFYLRPGDTVQVDERIF